MATIVVKLLEAWLKLLTGLGMLAWHVQKVAVMRNGHALYATWIVSSGLCGETLSKRAFRSSTLGCAEVC